MKTIDQDVTLPYPLTVLLKDAPPEIEVDNTKKTIVLTIPPGSKVRPSPFGPVLTHPELPPVRLIIEKSDGGVFARLQAINPKGAY